MISVDILTADRLATALQGKHDEANGIVRPGIALSQPIVASLFSKNGQLLFDDVRAGQRCACNHLGPPFDESQVCFDCDVETAEEAAWRRFRRFQRFLESNDLLMKFVRQCPGLLRDPLRQFWRLRWRHICWRDAIENPWPLLKGGHSQHASDDVAISPHEISDAMAGREEPKKNEIDRHGVGEMMHYHLGIQTPFVRVYDPTFEHNLVGIPRAVAYEICRIGREYDGQTVRDVRQVTNKIRKACKPLGSYRVSAERSAILLEYNGRYYNTVRQDKDPPTRNVTVGTGRAAGCSIQLLSETEKALKAEIRFFKKKGRLKRRVRRFSGPNPFVRKAKEDRLSVEQCFVGGKEAMDEPLGTPPVHTQKRKKRRERRPE